MTLSKNQQAVCALIAAALFECQETSFKQAQWNEIYEEMRAQTIHGLVYPCLEKSDINLSGRELWNEECLRVIGKSLLLMHNQSKLVSLLEREGIPYLILKGAAASMYYPNPLLRSMGDVDIYVPPICFDQALSLLQREGYHQKTDGKHYPRHIGFTKENTLFELHRSFATVNSEKQKQYLDSLLEQVCTQGKTERVTIDECQCSFYAAPAYINGLILLEHIGQHMRAGLGFRQILDWMMFAYRHLQGDGWSQFQPYAMGTGLEKIAKAVTKMCCLYLGLTGDFGWCMNEDKILCDELIAYLFQSGNFGRKTGNVGMVASVTAGYQNSKNPFQRLQSSGEYNWDYIRKHPWAKPFAWLYQLFRYAGKTLKLPHFLRTLIAGRKVADERKRLMDKLQIARW